MITCWIPRQPKTVGPKLVPRPIQRGRTIHKVFFFGVTSRPATLAFQKASGILRRFVCTCAIFSLNASLHDSKCFQIVLACLEPHSIEALAQSLHFGSKKIADHEKQFSSDSFNGGVPVPGPWGAWILDFGSATHFRILPWFRRYLIDPSSLARPPGSADWEEQRL